MACTAHLPSRLGRHTGCAPAAPAALCDVAPASVIVTPAGESPSRSTVPHIRQLQFSHTVQPTQPVLDSKAAGGVDTLACSAGALRLVPACAGASDMA
eukprot:363328-Chlamydomonas_euryale.AAC.4